MGERSNRMNAATVSAVVRVEREKDVAVVVIDNPPINAGSLEVRSGVLAAIEEASADSQVSAVVIIGGGTTFISGSDLREFGKPIADPQWPEVFAAIEACEKPVVAALHGAALGGGFELTMACDARVALSGTVVGLPEVTLGIIPGAGGTQRLPRLVGIPRAIAMIASGERVPAEAALSLGLVDKVVTSDLRSESLAWAGTMQGRKRKVRDLLVTACDESSIAKASESALRAGKNRPAVRAAIDAVVSAGSLSIDEGLAQERATFQLLRTSREARALRHQFFAERETAKQPGIDTAAARPVKKLAVIGAGTMGGGIAIAALDAGFDVVLLDQEHASLARGVDRIRNYYSGRAKAGKISLHQAEERAARLKTDIDWSTLSDADVVIEAVFEDLMVKQEVFRRLDEIVRPGAVLASNTSYIDLDAIAAVTARPQDVVGLHFFSPAHVMRLLEVVRGRATSPDVLATCLQLAKRLNKISVVSANAFGFVGNRIYAAYRRQCEFMLEEGATPEQVDTALEAFGFAMGPFAVADMSGLDIAWRMRQSLTSTRDPEARYVQIPDMLCEAGRLGQKTGAGYYKYEQEGGRRQPDPAVDTVLEQARTAAGIVPRAFSPDEITRRVLLTMVNEAALVLQQRVAQRASDIDVALVHGYGFPTWEGGPVFWAQERSAAELEKDLDWLAGLSGPGFIRGNPQQLISSVEA
jgi:3-hydroxyacyl-CoA dehydrogenase